MSQLRQNNSSSLKGAFPGVYGEFFNSCEIVVSAPFIFYWAGEYSVLHGGLSLAQKVPLRIYIGLETRKDKELVITDYSAFAAAFNDFEKLEFNGITERKIVKKIKEIFIREANLKNGFNIKILAESPLGRGITTSGAFCAALSAAILLFLGNIKAENILAWAGYPTEELLTKKNLDFDAIFRLAWKIESVIHGGCASGTGSAVAMIDSIYPVLYFTERRFGDAEQNHLANFPANVAKNFEVLDKIKYFVARLEEVIDLSSEPVWPIDFCLINTGLSKNTEAAIRSTLTIQRDLAAVEELQKKLKNLAKKQGKIELLFQNVKPGEFWADIIKNSGIHNLEIVYYIEKLLASGAPQYSLDDFIRLIDSCHGLYQYLELTAFEVEKIRFYLKTINECGSKLIGGGKGGDLLCVGEEGVFSQNFEQKIKKLEELCGQKIYVDYASWRDGFEKEGLKVEQFLKNNIISDFIGGDSKLVTIYDAGGPIKKHVTSEKLKELTRQADIFLDYENSRIFIKGRPLDSKKLHSTTKTLEIFKVLLEQACIDVPSQKFPESSYIDRNEMQSKIVSPMAKYFKKYTNKNLPLKISGGLASDFTLCLKIPKGIKIACVN
jgi:mevalonate kinase